jgi:uncharacterized membrane protein YfcA
MEFLSKIVIFIVRHSRGIRRTLGMFFLIAATAMILLGSRVLFHISPEGILMYWGVVFLLLFLALMVAYFDLKAIRRDFHIQKKALFISTFSDEEFRRKIAEKHPEFFHQQE